MCSVGDRRVFYASFVQFGKLLENEKRSANILEQLTDGKSKRVGKLHQSGYAQILFTPLNGSCERTSKPTPVRELLLRPISTFPQGTNAPAKLFPDRSGILHSTFNPVCGLSRPRSLVGRSLVGSWEYADRCDGDH